MKKTSKPIVVAMLLIASVALNGEAATDLIINEISPVAPAGGHAWIEFFNPTPGEVILAGLVVGTAEMEPFEVPETFPSLRPGGYLVLRFGPGPYGLHVEDGPPHLIVFTAPSRLAEVWLPSSGELMIGRPDPISPEAPEFVDYVAWGARGAEWSRTPERLSVWEIRSFVPLGERFGVPDPEKVALPGSSIGLYPGSRTREPEDWVVYDPEETSPGSANLVPRPKAFSLADGVTLGSRSLAVSWAKRKGDDWYRFQLARDPDFGDIVVDERSITPGIRVGESLQGRYFYRVSASSGGSESRMSRHMQANLRATQCNWAPPPPPWQEEWTEKMLDWLINPTCGGLPSSKCGIVSSIQFKFQRKDTPLVCLAGCNFDDYQPCAWDSPQPYCQKVTFSSGLPSFTLCAGGMLSPQCGWVSGTSPIIVSLPMEFDLTPIPNWRWFKHNEDPSQNSCGHGTEYCAMASISMMASAFGACLSQDTIAYRMYGGSPPPGAGQLAHSWPVLPNRITPTLKWAIGIEDSEFQEDPAPDSPNPFNPRQPAFVAAHFIPKPSPNIDFDIVKFWIRAHRPILALSGSHYRIVAGFCEDTAGDEWLFIFDSKDGPKVESFDDWQNLTVVSTTNSSPTVWVGPQAGVWQNAISDEGVWNDPDRDGLMDLDEERFGTDKGNPDSDGVPPGDKEEQIPSI